MNWLPPVADFRAELQAARALADTPLRQARLVALAGCRLNTVETIQLDRELARLAADAAAAPRPVKLALLADATVDHLLPAIRVAGWRHGLTLQLHVGGFGQWRAEILDPASALHAFEPDFVLLAPGAHAAAAGVALTADEAQAQQACDAIVDELGAAWARLRQGRATVVLQQNLLDTGAPLFGQFDALLPGSPAALVARLNARLAVACREAGVSLLDLARAAARDGRDAWFDRGRWLQAKMAIAPQAATRYADLLVRLVAAHRGRARKCLVLDLDNTLWGGVVGDDGIAGLRLGQGSAVGEAHLALQQYAKALAGRGILLAVCSKNDPALAESVFREHPEMALRRDDIAAFVANWDDKAANLQRIAGMLNIGLDSLVFVDDNPAERARIRASLPAVAVPELPPDPAGYVDCIAEAGYFEAVTFTDEDRARSRYYAAASQRAELQGGAQSMDEFLRGLDMVVRHGPVGALELERATQLVNKTNQFNTTTRRLSAHEVRRYADGPHTLALQFRLLDRLGDNGLVSVVLLRDRAEDGVALDIDLWVMSCRVFGRGFEHEILNILAETARRRGAAELRADFVPSERNGVIAGLFEQLGFQPIGDNGAASRWRLTLADHRPHPTHIRHETGP